MKRACHMNCGEKSGGKGNTRRKRNKNTLPEPLLERSIICSRCLTIWLQLVQYLKSLCLWLVQATSSVCSSLLQVFAAARTWFAKLLLQSAHGSFRCLLQRADGSAKLLLQYAICNVLNVLTWLRTVFAGVGTGLGVVRSWLYSCSVAAEAETKQGTAETTGPQNLKKICAKEKQLRQGTSSEHGPLSDPMHIERRTTSALDGNRKEGQPRLPKKSGGKRCAEKNSLPQGKSSEHSEQGPLSDPKRIYSRMKHAFDSNSKNAKPQLPLLSDWKLYLKHLPRRHNEVSGKYDALYENPFYVSDTDLIKFAQAIGRNLERKSVRQIVAPSGAGKTASVLPAFLQMQSWRKSTGEAGSSTVADAYVYCPFNNNGDRCHSPPWTPWTCCLGLVDPVRLGQAYFLVCFELLMQGRYFNNFWHHLTMWVYLARGTWNADFFVNKMEQLVDQAVGPVGKILLHIDEHFQISEVCKIRQGVLTLASHASLRTLVVTTYTKITAELDGARSDVQRQFVALPPLPCSYILHHNARWKLENEARNTADANNDHALASLALLLGVLFQCKGPQWLHLPPDDRFSHYNEFNKHRRNGNIQGCCVAIAEELRVLVADVKLDQAREELFFHLSRGIPSDDEEHLKNPNLSIFGVVAYENRITLPILRMLRTDTYNISLPRRLLLKSLISKPSEIPMNKTLEYAFMFAFLCGVKVNNAWSVRQVRKTGSNGGIELDSFESDTLAYTNDCPPHPYVDMWMKPLPDKLVLMQITGSTSEEKLHEKCGQLEQARQLVQGAFPGWTVDAYMLAPNAPESMGETVGGNVKIFVTEARKWLGGMAQLLPSLAS